MNETKVLRSLHPSSTTRRSLTVGSVLRMSFHRKCRTDLLLVIVYVHWSVKSYKIIECNEQIIRHHVFTTLTIWLTGRWSSVRVKLTLTDGQGFLQCAHT